MTVRFLDDAAQARKLAFDFLAREPVQNNLLLTLLEARIAEPEPARFWWAEEGGFALQSPFTRKVNLSAMPLRMVEAMAETIGAHEVPGVLAAAPTATRFVEVWGRLWGGAREVDTRHRMYEQAPAPSLGWRQKSPSGRLRPATADDLMAVTDLLGRFMASIGDDPVPAADLARKRVEARVLYLWDDKGPRVLVGHTRPTCGVARINSVFTPESDRGKGYATAATAALARILETSGLRRMLYADDEDPVAGRVYRRIGFRSVSEVLGFRFSPAPAPLFPAAFRSGRG
jgi:GNAT superfamily N-acetyltransferase